MTRDLADQRSGEKGYSVFGHLTDEKRRHDAIFTLIILPPPSLFVQGTEQFHIFSAIRETAGVFGQLCILQTWLTEKGSRKIGKKSRGRLEVHKFLKQKDLRRGKVAGEPCVLLLTLALR